MKPSDPRWVDVSLYIPTAQGGLLIDAPEGVTRGLDRQGLLSHVRTIVISSDRMTAVSGLPALLGALDASGLPAPSVIHLVTDRRTPLLVTSWNQGWTPTQPVSSDAIMCGMPFDLEGAHLVFTELPLAECREGVVRPTHGCAVQVHRPSGTLTWLPTCRPTTRLRPLCEGVDLAVIEVGTLAWPRSAHPWRLSLQDAIGFGSRANDLWLVGDDRRRMPDVPVA